MSNEESISRVNSRSQQQQACAEAHQQISEADHRHAIARQTLREFLASVEREWQAAEQRRDREQLEAADHEAHDHQLEEQLGIASQKGGVL